MELTTAKKLVVITEAAIETDVLRIIDKQGARGYTIYRGIAGKGSRGIRSGSGGMSTFGENVRIETVVATEEKAKAIMELIINNYLANKYAGLVYLEDVQVARIAKF
ncbi:MAG: DUF190 domain-containing protein [Syntrophomonadaceae bacterium]|nr:DUF190 domain-containing protein [Syntrophomonadaceae bacterium]